MDGKEKTPKLSVSLTGEEDVYGGDGHGDASLMVNIWQCQSVLARGIKVSQILSRKGTEHNISQRPRARHCSRTGAVSHAPSFTQWR
jgi:hypothetical protein